MHLKKVHFGNSYPDYTNFSLVQIPRLKFIQAKVKNDKNSTFPRRIGFERSNAPVQDSFGQKIKRVGTEFLVLFFNSSSIHGLNHLTQFSRHPVEIIIWLFIVGMALFGVVYLSLGTWQRYQINPTVISMERDRFGWNTSFPPATICPTIKMNEQKLRNEIGKYNFSDNEKAMEFITKLAHVNYSSLTSIDFPDFNEIEMSNSGSTGDQFQLEKTITELGICYAFNSQLARYSAPDYWASGKWNQLYGNNTFYVHPLDGEVFANIVNMSTGFYMYMHGPEETIDLVTQGQFASNGFFLQMYLAASALFSTDSAKELTIQQRKCRFIHESNLRHSPAVYSYNLCRMECRIQLCLKKCKCIPHWYRPREGEKVCDIKGLQCLHQYKDLLIFLDTPGPGKSAEQEDSTIPKTHKSLCSCLPNCDYVKYVIEVADAREWFLGSNLQWGLKYYPRMRLKRDILFGFTDVLVYVGGMAGLFLGCSVLSFAEIIYFFTIRLFWFVIEYRKQTHIILNK
ncbi:sodium channel protein Nach-like [Chrysoperla carnea]|uniref:sodium channel protein Nach-like n=1 Tax=Chrysoperla carnea TaxID=189513 RepID=UPI001D0710BC|nr:sodium channel protein Nach-like [Chrysoperla carnea]